MWLRKYSITISSLFFFGVIGLTLGVVLNRLWLILGGLALGAILGWAVETTFRRSAISPRKALRIFILVLLILALGFIYVALPAYGANRGIHPSRGPAKVTPQTMGLAYEDVQLTTEDGLRLTGWYLPARNGAAVIALHGLNGNRSSCLVHAYELVQAGYGVLLLDMRAHGESQGEVFNEWGTYLDVLAGVYYLQSRPEVDANRIGGIGLSSGATALLYAAAQSPDIQALMLDGAAMGRTEDALGPMLPTARKFFFMTPVNWMYYQFSALFGGVRMGPALKERIPLIAPRPMLFIAGGKEPLEAELALRYAGLAGPNAEAWIIPDVGHMGGIILHPEEYKVRMMAFFERNLPGR